MPIGDFSSRQYCDDPFTNAHMHLTEAEAGFFISNRSLGDCRHPSPRELSAWKIHEIRLVDQPLSQHMTNAIGAVILNDLRADRINQSAQKILAAAMLYPVRNTTINLVKAFDDLLEKQEMFVGERDYLLGIKFLNNCAREANQLYRDARPEGLIN
jgi:hypothetical protein